MSVSRPLKIAVSVSLATIFTVSSRAQNQQQASNQNNAANQNNSGSNQSNSGNSGNSGNNLGNQSTNSDMPPDNFGDGNLAGGNNFGNANSGGGNNFGNSANQGGATNQANSANGLNNTPADNNFGNSAQTSNVGNGNAAMFNNSGGNPATTNSGAINQVPTNAAPANAVPINPAASNAAPANAAPTNAAPTNAAPTNAAPTNAAPTNAAPANAAPANAAPTNAAGINAGSPPNTAGPPAPTGPAELKFNFDQNGLPAPHSFVLKWDNSAANLTSIIVKMTDNQEVLQTIAVPQDGSINLVYNALTPKPGRITDTIFSYIDFNFDKFGDIRLTKRWPYKVGEKSYLVWVFNPNANQYVIHKAISDLPNAFPDAKTRRIESISLGGWGGGEYEKRWYSLTSKGNLKLQTIAKQTIRDRFRLVFNREVRQRINGEMQRICKLVVPTEGRVQRLWGTPERCHYHMEKQVIP